MFTDRKKVLIIGAGFLQSFVIKRARELGYITYALDGNEKAIGFQYSDFYEHINIVDTEKCLKYAVDNKIDGVLTAATDYGVLTAAYIAEKMHLKGLDLGAAELIKNKHKVRNLLYENRIDDTEQTYEVNSDTDMGELSNIISYPVMVKPCDGSGSRGTSRADNAKELKHACEYAMKESPTGRAEVESFIVGDEYGAESFVENGNIHVLAIMKKWMTKPPYYAELGHAIPCGLPEEVESRIKECVKKAIKSLRINFGSVNMDLLLTKENKIHIVDIGARMGGNLIGSHIVPIGTGIDYMGNIIKASLGDETDFTYKNERSVATKLLALKEGTVKELPDFGSIERKYGVRIIHHLHVGDKITQYRTNLDGCGYVVATDSTADKAEKLAMLAKTEIDNSIIRQ